LPPNCNSNDFGYIHSENEPQEAVGKAHKVFCEASYVQSGEYISGKYPRVSKTDDTVWLEGTYNPIFDNRKQLVKIVEFASNAVKSIEKIVVDAQHSVELVEQTGDTVKKINQRKY
jgi:methyl-accepting chemotaxis protein